MSDGLWLRVRLALFAVLALATVAGLVAFYVRLPRPEPVVVTLTPVAAATPGARPVVVYVSGAVRSTGIYTLRDGDRVARAVEAAGGFAPEADQARINLAALLKDGQQVHVPALDERTASAAATATSAATLVGPVNINTATADELKALPGIGDSYARAIVDYRTRNGPFQRPEDIVKVRGIGPQTYQRLKDLITVE
ncbi:MAG: ComEA family DNA-binding protein [Chloroflexota bacterium]